MSSLLSSIAKSVTSPTSAPSSSSSFLLPPPSSSPDPVSVITSSFAPVPPDRVPALFRALRKVPALLDARSATLEELTPSMVRLLASHNAEVKAAACEFVVRAAGEPGKRGKPPWEPSNPEVGLLALSVLKRDLSDPNPEIRVTAVSTICQLKVLAEENAVEAIDTALKDSNPFVRRAGVTACAKLHYHSPELALASVVDPLYSQIRDPDPAVVTFAMQTVNRILEEEGGIVMPDSMAKYLVKRLGDFPNFELCFVLDYLRDHFCDREASSDEVRLLLLNAMDPYLDSKDGHIFLSAARLFLKAASTMKNSSQDNDGDSNGGGSALAGDFAARVRPQLVKFLKPTSQPTAQEFQVELLKFMTSVDARHWLAAAPKSSSFPFESLHLPKRNDSLMVEGDAGVGVFAIRSKDSLSLRRWKLNALCHLAGGDCDEEDDKVSSATFDYILRLLRKDAASRDSLSMHLCQLASKKKQRSSELVRELSAATAEEPATFAPVSLRCARELSSSSIFEEEEFVEMVDLAVRELISGLDCGRAEEGEKKDGAASTTSTAREVLWALRAHRGRLTRAPAYLKALLERLGEAQARSLEQPLLSTGAVVFASNPAATQRTLGRIFRLCLTGGATREARERVALYSGLLREQEFVDAISSSRPGGAGEGKP